jgi:hypothetical protein
MGMQMGMQRGGGIRLIMRPDVQKELAVTDAQKTKIAELFPDRRAGGPGGGPAGGAAGPRGGGQGGPAGGAGAGGPRGGGQGGPAGGAGAGGPRGGFDPAQMQAQQAEQEKKLQAILNETQWKRFNELRLQQEGVNALMRPEVAKEVGLSEAQTTKLREVQQSSQEAMREAMMAAREGGGMDREGMMAVMEMSRKDTDAKIHAVHNETQRVKWQAMQGKAFKFEEIGR